MLNQDFVSKIIRLYSEGLKQEFTIKDISRKSGLTYNAAHRTVQQLVSLGVLSIRKLAFISLVSVNKNALSFTLFMLNYASSAKSEHELLNQINEIWNKNAN